jgi:hypothetical protein
VHLALKVAAPSVDLAVMPAKQHAGPWAGSVGDNDRAEALEYKITPHLGSPRPRWDTEAMELLWHRLDLGRGDTSFSKVGLEITAIWQLDTPLPVERDELVELGRLAVLEIVRDACRRPPELEFEWFAVSPSHA